MTQNELKKQIQSYCFAVYDMLLYLDTHPDDRRAFAIFKDLVKKSCNLKNEYQREYGPLTVNAAADSSTFDWIDGPWPWEKGGNS